MKDLEKYSKQEIINAIRTLSHYYGFNGIEERLIDKINDNHREEAFKKASAARQNEIDCMNKYFAWQKEMIKKYGDGQACRLGAIPSDERIKGLNLQCLWKDAEAKRKSLEKIEDSYFTERV